MIATNQEVCTAFNAYPAILAPATIKIAAQRITAAQLHSNKITVFALKCVAQQISSLSLA